MLKDQQKQQLNSQKLCQCQEYAIYSCQKPNNSLLILVMFNQKQQVTKRVEPHWFQTQIRLMENLDPISSYFSITKQLKDYLGFLQNTRVSFKEKRLQILGISPTKKEEKIKLAQYDLQSVKSQRSYYQNEKKRVRKTFSAISEDKGTDIEMIIQEIVEILYQVKVGQIKSRETQIQEEARQMMRASKQEMDSTFQKRVKQLKEQITMANSKKFDEIGEKIAQCNKNCSELSSRLDIFTHQINLFLASSKETRLDPHSNKEQHIDLLKLINSEQQQRKCQTKQLKTQYERLDQQLKSFRNFQHSQIQQQFIKFSSLNNQLLQKELIDFEERLNSVTDKKMCQYFEKLPTKDETDVIIQKIKNVALQLQYLKVEKQQKDLFNQQMSLQKNKILQLQAKMQQFSKICIFSQQTPSEVPKYLIPVNIKEWIDEKCANFGRMSLYENKINLDSSGGARIFSKIYLYKKCEFSVRINKIQNRISLGFASAQYKQKVFQGDEEFIIYYQNDKKLKNGKIQKSDVGEGFKTGDVVRISVDINAGKIFWKVGNIIKCQLTNKRLSQLSFEWVPYIKMHDRFDQITVFQ